MDVDNGSHSSSSSLSLPLLFSLLLFSLSRSLRIRMVRNPASSEHMFPGPAADQILRLTQIDSASNKIMFAGKSLQAAWQIINSTNLSVVKQDLYCRHLVLELRIMAFHRFSFSRNKKTPESSRNKASNVSSLYTEVLRISLNAIFEQK